MRRLAPSLAWAYAIVLYGFIFLPVIVLVLFSFQATMFPVAPFNGPSLRWYQTVLGDERLTAALANSLIVANPEIRFAFRAEAVRRSAPPRSGQASRS